MTLAPRQVFYADGDRTNTGVIRAVLEGIGVHVAHFAQAQDCLASLSVRPCDLLISNSRQAASEGISLLVKATRAVPGLPVILVVNQGDIRTAVRAMKAGACDCLERPVRQEDLVCAVETALRDMAAAYRVGVERLTESERAVLRLVLEGHTTRQIATRLRRSRRTVEAHRSHIMRKLEVSRVGELAQVAASLGLLGTRDHWRRG